MRNSHSNSKCPNSYALAWVGSAAIFCAKSRGISTCPKSSPCPCRALARSKSNGVRTPVGNSILGMPRKQNVSVREKPASPMNLAAKSLSRRQIRALTRRPIRNRRQAIHGRPYDAPTLADVVARVEARTGARIQRCYLDKGYRDHKLPDPRRVFISGQKHEVHGQIKK